MQRLLPDGRRGCCVVVVVVKDGGPRPRDTSISSWATERDVSFQADGADICTRTYQSIRSITYMLATFGMEVAVLFYEVLTGFHDV